MLALAQRELATFVYDSVALEGLTFTLPEIQTLLDGITVGGHRLSDQQIALNQGRAWRTLFSKLKDGSFQLDLQSFKDLHFLAAEGEALNAGHLRSAGVTISGTTYLPPEASLLSSLFVQMCESVAQQTEIYDAATLLFLMAARNQYFFDVNKRTGRLMMNGLLLNAGYPAINVPATRQLEFNTKMIGWYESSQPQEMQEFLRSCLDPRVIDILRKS